MSSRDDSMRQCEMINEKPMCSGTITRDMIYDWGSRGRQYISQEHQDSMRFNDERGDIRTINRVEIPLSLKRPKNSASNS